MPKGHAPLDEVAGHRTNPFVGLREKAGAEAARRRPAPGQAPVMLAEELLEELRFLHETQSQLAAHLRGQLVNDVLDVRMVTLDVDGAAALEFRTMVGSVLVANHNATGSLIVSSAPKTSSPAGVGRGQYLVRAGTAATVPIGSHTVTLWGTAGNVVSVQAFTVRVQPYTGAC